MPAKRIDGDEVERLYVECGLSVSATAEALGVSATPVRRVLDERCIKIRDRGRETAPEVVQKIMELWRSGVRNCREISRRTGVYHSTVSKIVRANGERPGRGSPPGLRGAMARAWKGGRRKVKGGYVDVYMPDHPMAKTNGYVAEHRLVASEVVGRVLDKSEEVHHIYGNKDDNRPENLAVVSKGKHQRLHADVCRELWALRSEVSRLSSLLAPGSGNDLKVVG